jgi:hypothetical protein
VNLLTGYLNAKVYIEEAGFRDDIEWAENLLLMNKTGLTSQYVLREHAWVVLNSGFRFQVAAKLWPNIRRAFHGFEPHLVQAGCATFALQHLNHPGKLNAMVEMAELVRKDGIEPILKDAEEPLKLCRLPWIGKTTCWHYAKVLGVDVVKPDVHLRRAAKATGFQEPVELAQAIKDELGDPLTVVDSVLWRYGEQRAQRGWPDWKELFG